MSLTCMFYRRTISLTSFVLPLPGCCALQPPEDAPRRHEAALRVRVTQGGMRGRASGFKQKCKALKGGTKKKQVGGY